MQKVKKDAAAKKRLSKQKTDENVNLEEGPEVHEEQEEDEEGE